MQSKFIFIALPIFLYCYSNVFSQVPDLGAAAPFALFTAAGAFNGDAATTINGDIGTNAGAYTPPGFLVGQVHLADPVSAQAAADLGIAYGYLFGLTCGAVLTTPLGNSQTLGPNIYCISTAAVLNADLILDGGGNPGAVFVFQIDGALSTNTFSNIILINGANLCNVYWQINGAFNVGGNTVFRGTVLADGAINLGNGASLFGRGLSTSGAISTSANLVTLPTSCNCSLEIACPSPNGGNFQCISQIPAGSAADVAVTSSCGATSVMITNTATGTGCSASPYHLTRQYTVTDTQGHSATCVVTYTAVDLTAPTITCPANVSVSCTSLVPNPNTATVTAATDNCTGAPTVTFLGDVLSNQTCANRETITRTFQAADACGNSATCSQTITVNDQTPPSIACPTNVSVSCTSAVPTASIASVTVGNDNCNGIAPTVTFLGDAISNQTCANRETITRTFQAADACGNTATCAQIITVNDQTPPSIVCPANVSVSCASAVPTANTAGVTVGNDNCSGAAPTVTFLGDVVSNQTCANRETITRTFQAADACGNTATCAQVITVNDQTAPSIVCPTNVSVSCANAMPVNTASVTAGTDNCGGATPTITFVGDALSNQTCANRVTITRTYRVSDACGNTATCAQTITVNDQTAPSIICPSNVSVSCANAVPVNTATVTAGTDNCGGTTPTITFIGDALSNQTCANRLTITRTYQVSDACGNTATCAQTITVNDQTAPTIVCLANITVSCSGDVPAANPNAIVTTDLCGGAVSVVHVGDVITNQICSNRYTILRTYRATDACGNSATCAQTITVLDLSVPTFINPPANITVECSQIPAEANLIATDNCSGSVAVTYLGQTQSAGICPVLYTLTRRWVAVDACGNSASLVQLITVVDTQAPQFTSNAVDAIMECSLLTNETTIQNFMNTAGGAVVSDCSAITWSSQQMALSNGCGATSRRTMRFIATDVCGNSAFQDADMIMIDQTPPVFNVLPQNLEVECAEGSNGEGELLEWLEHFGNAQVVDQCGTVTTDILQLSETPGCGATWSRNYQFRATDECGNTRFVTATFSIVDHTPPVIIKCPPGNVNLTCIHDIPGPDLAGVIATDNCGGPVKIMVTTYTSGTGCKSSPMTTSYWYMASDECGNMVSNCDQSFQVVDLTAPSYTGPDTILVNCISDLPASGEVMTLLMPLMADNCYDFTCIGHVTGQIDSNTVTYTMIAKDFCGNVADEFSVTFIATGSCKPICSASQTVWGDPNGRINDLPMPTVIEKLITQNGGVTAGKAGKTIVVSSANCLQQLLPGNDSNAQLQPGNNEFSAANDCLPTSPLLNEDGTLKNRLAANVLALQLNIWYNRDMNQRNLGMRLLAELPSCLIDHSVLAQLENGHLTVQGLLDMSNNYLAGVGFFPRGFGILLNEALENVNNYWSNCQINDPCSSFTRSDLSEGHAMMHWTLSPNPVQDQVTIHIEAAMAAEVQVRFVGNTGLQSSTVIEVVKGDNAFSFPTSQFQPGLYTIVLQEGKDLKTLRMVKVAN